MALYSIKQETLTDIGDALRRKWGETHKEPLYLDYVVSSSNNITSADGVSSAFLNFAYENTITIPNAVRLFVKLTYMAAEHMMPNYVFTINDTVYSTNSHTKTYSEINLDGDTVTFKYTASGKGVHCYYAEISGYDADGNIILNDTGETVDVPNTYKSSEMAQAIDDIPPSPPAEAFVISGNCSYRFANNGLNWFIKQYGDRITTKDISGAGSMFNGSTSLVSIPFEINFDSTSNYCSISNMFQSCNNLVTLSKINALKVYNMSNMFNSCYRLRVIPEDFAESFDWSYLESQNSAYTGQQNSIFSNCYSLRSFPISLIKSGNPYVNYSYSYFSSGFRDCSSLDELTNLPIPYTNATWTSNAFNSTFSNCYRLKNITFAKQEDGSPIIVKWKSQVIDLSTNTGYSDSGYYILNFNSGITADKEVTDDATYQVLKDNPDWFTLNAAYSRYNHDSAVATINSLPDTSAYLAEKGGTNTIKFKGTAGASTDGGAINTLTEEEIAVAAAKGWTVTLV